MSTKINVPEDVKGLINNIIAENNLHPTANVSYDGSKLGDGSMSKTATVDINSQKGDLQLFVKYVLNAKYLESMGFNKMYDNETHFYNVIVPAYVEFLKEKGLENSFSCIPKCYGTTNDIVALENLRKKGYQLCDKELIASDAHITLVFKTYAKLHAISFAFNDQKSEDYQKLLSGVTDIYGHNMDEQTAARLIESNKNEIYNFLEQLDPVKDQFILDRSEKLIDEVTEFSKSMNKLVFDNSVLVHGDSWCNNMMFTYKNDKTVPLDVKLIDWQIIHSSSPVFDLSCFFYTAAPSSKQLLKKLNFYLEIYHEELSAQIRQMGSNPEKIYPYSAFEADWKRFCKYGYIMAFATLRAMLSNKHEAPNFERKQLGKVTEVFPTLERNDELIDRLRNLTQHLLLNEFI